jgi:DNA-binding transcriptional ArsR family regulator
MLENLDIASSTLSYQLNKLVESRIIDVFHYGKDKGYNLKKENEILWIIERYGLDDIFKEEDEIDDS